jgi:hypothetical protein
MSSLRLGFVVGLFAIAFSGCGEHKTEPDRETERLEATKKQLDKEAAEAHERAEALNQAAAAERAVADLYGRWAQAQDAVAKGKTAAERAALAAQAVALDAQLMAARKRAEELTKAARMKATSDPR